MEKAYAQAIRHEILPLLKEYWFDDQERVKEWAVKLEAKFEQTAFHPGLFEGLFLILAGVVVGTLLLRLLKWRLATVITMVIPTALTLGVLVMDTRTERLKLEAENMPRLWLSHSRDVGLALDGAVPKKSVLFQDFERDPGEGAEVQSMIFWSGRMTHRGLAHVPLAQAKGYHPYLISPAAEAYAPVPGMPLYGWLRAYDLEAPGPVAALPEGLIRVGAKVRDLTVLGAAAGPAGRGRDRWAFYVQGTPDELSVVFQTDAGDEEVKIPAAACLRNANRLATAAWFILPALGPKRAHVKALKFGDQVVALP